MFGLLNSEFSPLVVDDDLEAGIVNLLGIHRSLRAVLSCAMPGIPNLYDAIRSPVAPRTNIDTMRLTPRL